jgi:hypothetical protein
MPYCHVSDLYFENLYTIMTGRPCLSCTVYNYKTPLLSFFINSLPCHQNILCDSLFIKNETPIESSLIAKYLPEYNNLWAATHFDTIKALPGW